MELGGIIGIAVAVALGIYFKKKHPSPTGRGKIFQGLMIAITAAVVAGGISLGVQYLRYRNGTPNQSDIDRTVEAAQNYPLFGVVLEDFPELKPRLRATVEAEIKNPIKDGPNRLTQFGAEIRKRYITPMLLKADDASAIKASNADADFVAHLQKSDIASCREFGLTGLNDPKKLDREGTEKLKRLLAAREVAYRSGKASRQPREELTMDQVSDLLAEAGYSQADFDQLTSIETLATAEACAATAKLYSAPGKLPPAKAADLSRYLLAAGG